MVRSVHPLCTDADKLRLLQSSGEIGSPPNPEATKTGGVTCTFLQQFHKHANQHCCHRGSERPLRECCHLHTGFGELQTKPGPLVGYRRATCGTRDSAECDTNLTLSREW